MPVLEPINTSTYRIALAGDQVILGDIDSPSVLAHLVHSRWHGNNRYTLSYPGTPSGLATVDIANGTITIPYGDIRVELTAHDVSAEAPAGRAEFNVILASQPAPDANGDYWQVLDFSAEGLSLERVLGLDEEYDQAACYDAWYAELYEPENDALYGHDNGTGIFVRTPTEIRTPDGQVVLRSRPEHEVHSVRGVALENTHSKAVLGQNKDNGQDISYSNVTRDHLHIPRRSLVDSRGRTARIEDVTYQNGQLRFKLPRAFIEAGSTRYPVRHATGVDPAYTQDMDSWTIGTANAWTNYDLYTDKGVPKGAVAEVIAGNIESGTEEEAGVRTDGSSLARYLLLHEAEPGGPNWPRTHLRLFVTCDSSTGLVECYVGNTTVNFVLAGYWENVTFTELMTSFVSSTSSWYDNTLSAGASCVHHILQVSSAPASPSTVGTRSNGSSLERKIKMHEAEAGGVGSLDLLVKADSSKVIETFSDQLAYGTFYDAGYFGTELDFVEKWTALSPGTSWAQEDLTAYLDEDGRHCDFLLSHSNEATDQLLGVRDGDDSSTERSLREHESESLLGTSAEYTGFSMSAKSNSSGQVYTRGCTSYNGFYLTGYFKPAGAAGATFAEIYAITLANMSEIYGITKANAAEIYGFTTS